ncbi:hypothetical protein GGR53DRAFT_530844 [Hypoxylon sp. FL1150]|nr:hypothetical protein GGR53DRAFT_530844 [Hypoxylon sp. FL1150]
MATSGVPNRNDDEVVVVTLIPRPADTASSPSRQFILSRDHPSIRIGRTSRLPTKGFIASVDNAWFDSPVMSRHHAEFILDSSTSPKGVFIKDIGSLHGTFHTPGGTSGQEIRLEQQRLVKLSSGDSLRFGTDIFRAKETFPPCVVDFYTLEHEREINAPSADATANRAFAFYESDDGDDDNDDDESVIETGMSTMTTHTIPRGPSIDLTQDGDDGSSEANKDRRPASTTIPVTNSVIDLTSDAEEDEGLEGPGRETLVGKPGSAEFYTLPPYRAPAVSECPPRLAAAIASHTAQYFPPTTEDRPDLGESGIVDNQYSSEEDSDVADIAEQGETLRDESMPEGVSLGAVDLHDSDSAMTEDSVSDTSDVDVDAEDIDSVISETNEYAESYDSMDEDEHLECQYSDDDASSSSSDSTDSLSSPSSPAPLSSPNSFLLPISKETASGDVLTESASPKQSFVKPYLFTVSAEQVSMDHTREPSPSDAALFKGRPLYDQEPSDTRAQALGDKSGKHEFFQARESNRTSLTNILPPPPISAIRETLSNEAEKGAAGLIADDMDSALWPSEPDSSPSKAADELVDTADAIVDSVPGPQNATHVLKDSATAQDSMWSLSGQRFINHPGSEDLPSPWELRPQSPEFDETSAYTYQQSKMATESSASQQLRRVGIPDLLTQEPNNSQDADDTKHAPSIMSPWVVEQADVAPITEKEEKTESVGVQTTLTSPMQPCGAKRLHDDAFADDEFNDNWPSHEVLLSQVKALTDADVDPTPELPSIQAPHNTGSDVDEAPLPQAELTVTASTRRDDVQPSKRRRFAQAAAYVALGGAAAFTYMVSTAPVL